MTIMACTRWTVPFVAMMALIISYRSVQSLDMDYCASVNTAGTPTSMFCHLLDCYHLLSHHSNHGTDSSIWQSNGLCHDFCVEKSFAFAILQGHYCWCSDYVPVKSSQVDTDECHDPCPGWLPDTCGSHDLFGYIALDIAPSGTAAGSSTSTSSVSILNLPKWQTLHAHIKYRKDSFSSTQQSSRRIWIAGKYSILTVSDSRRKPLPRR